MKKDILKQEFELEAQGYNEYLEEQEAKKKAEKFSSLTSLEKETIINFNEEEKTASIYTYNKAYIRKLTAFCKQRPDLYKLINHDKEWGSYTFEVPKKYVSVRLPKNLSDEQKAEASSRMKKLRNEQVA